MSQLTSHKVSYTFVTPALPDAFWRVLSFQLHDTLTMPYDLNLHVIPPPQTDLSKLLGASCTFTIHHNNKSYPLHVICTRYEELDAAPGMTAGVRLYAGPGLLALKHSSNARIFQGKSVPEVLEEVLTEGLARYGRQLKVSLQKSYEKREYCTQYHETDLDFVDRLLHEEGIGYYFDHAGDVEQLVLFDDNTFHADRTGAEVSQIPLTAGAKSQESITEFTATQQIRTTKVTVHDFDWTRPANALSNAQGGDDANSQARELFVPVGSTALAYNGSAYSKDNTEQRAQKMLQVELMRQWEGTRGTGYVTGFAAGVVFELVGHDVAAYNQKYIVTAVNHAGSDAWDASGVKTAAVTYQNNFECIPLTVAYRPHLPHVRTISIPGLQTATVVGPEGEEVWPDEHGRVQVCFHWDRTAKAAGSDSCWVRVNQSWAGAAFGSVFVPRIGMEVIVGFMHGDPDKPIVLGCAYNGANLTPYEAKAAKTKSVLRTRTSPGGDGYNELTFEDAKDAEEVYLRAQRNMRAEVLNDKDTQIGHNEALSVTGNRDKSVGGNQTLAVKGNDSATITGNRSVTVSGGATESVSKNKSISVDGNMDTAVQGNSTVSVQGNASVSVDKDVSEEALGQRQIRVTKDMQVEVQGKLAHQVTKSLASQAENIELTAKTGYVLRQGDASITLKNGEVHIKASKIKINGDDVTIKASAKLVAQGSNSGVN